MNSLTQIKNKMDSDIAYLLAYGSISAILGYYVNTLRRKAIMKNNDIAAIKIWKLKDLLEEVQVNNRNPNFGRTQNTDDFSIFNNLVISGFLKSDDPVTSELDPKKKNLIYLKSEKINNYIGGNIRNVDKTKSIIHSFSEGVFLSDTKEEINPPFKESKLYISLSNPIRKDISNLSKSIVNDYHSPIVISSFSALKQIFPFRSVGFHVNVTESQAGVLFGTPAIVFGNLIYNKKENCLSFQSVEKLFKNASEFNKYLNQDTGGHTFLIWLCVAATCGLFGYAASEFM